MYAYVCIRTYTNKDSDRRKNREKLQLATRISKLLFSLYKKASVERF